MRLDEGEGGLVRELVRVRAVWHREDLQVDVAVHDVGDALGGAPAWGITIEEEDDPGRGPPAPPSWSI